MLANGLTLLTSADGRVVMQFTVDSSSVESAYTCLERLGDSKISVEIKKYRPRRSLNANSYCWVLIGKIADVMRLPKDEVYRKFIHDFGNYIELELNDDEVLTFQSKWARMGLGNQSEISYRRNGKTALTAYLGSSQYSTAEMSRFIDLIQQECDNLGIETYTPEEVAQMLGEWDG